MNPTAHGRDLDEEMRFHEEMDAAHQRDVDGARRRFGNRTYYREETRRMTWLASVDVLTHDARYAWRAVWRSPAFTALVVLTLALGIGLNTAAFSVLDRIYLRPPAGVSEPGTVRRIWIESSRYEGGKTRAAEAMTFPMFRGIAAAWGDSTQLAASTIQQARLGTAVNSPEVQVTYATANYFDVLGVRPELGRFYTRDEDRLGSAAHVVVLSHRFWRSRLAGDSAIIGKTIELDGDRFTVIGVADRAFNGINLEPVDVWIPIRAIPQPDWLGGKLFDSPRMYIFHALLRAPPQSNLREFEHQSTVVARQLNREAWPNNPDTTLKVYATSVIRARGPGEAGQEWVISTRLAGVAAIVLLIACANVVNLLLARAVRRRREIAVRLALGISRARMVRLLTTEMVVIGLLASAASLIAGAWGGSLLRSLLLPDVEWPDAVMHWRVVLFTLGVALLASLFAGIIPAIQFSRPELSDALKEGARDGTMHRSRLRNGLLVAQAALSLVLLVGAALFIQSLRNVQDLDIGFDSRQLLFGHVAFATGASPGDRAVGVRMREIEERLRSRPGIEGVARAGIEPMRGFSFYSFYWGPGGKDSSESLKNLFPVMSAVSPEFFAATGIKVLRGSVFANGAADQVLVNEETAKLLWPGIEPIGECMYFAKRTAPCHRVVGVVETVRRDKLIEEPAPQYYLPLGTSLTKSWGGSTIVVRVKPGAEAAARIELTALLKEAFPDAEPRIRAMSETLEPQYRPWRLGATLFAAYGVLAVIVALVGIYSTVWYAVTQRTHEFGVRVALGARLIDVLRQVVGEGVRVVAVGVALGVALALAAGRLISSLLYGIEPGNPAILFGVAGLLLLISALAALIPAWRAASVDPVVALRSE